MGNTKPEKCPCGRDLHYKDDEQRKALDNIIGLFGPNIMKSSGNKMYSVPRVYIALHGDKNKDWEKLGFKEWNKKK